MDVSEHKTLLESLKDTLTQTEESIKRSKRSILGSRNSRGVITINNQTKTIKEPLPPQESASALEQPHRLAFDGKL